VLVQNSTESPPSESAAQEVVTVAKDRQFPISGELPMVANVIVELPCQSVDCWIGLLKTDLKRRKCQWNDSKYKHWIRSGRGEAARNFKNAGIKTGIDIRQRNKHSSEAIVAHDYRSRTSRIRRAARYPSGLADWTHPRCRKFFLLAEDCRDQRCRRDGSDLGRWCGPAYGFCFPGSRGYLKVSERLELCLKRISVYVRCRLIGQSTENIDLGRRGASGVATECPVGSHSKSKIWIRWIAIGQPGAAK